MESERLNLTAPDELPEITGSELESCGPTLIVAPHADDESLGCGGVIALLRRMSVPVTIVVLSDGTLSHPNSVKYPPDRLRVLREDEARDAAAILGVEPNAVEFFGYLDRSVPAPGSPQFHEAVECVRKILIEKKVSAIFVPWRRDPHPDHRAAFEIVTAASEGNHRIFEYPIWLGHLAEDADAPMTGEVEAVRVDISGVLDAKRQAIQAHRSQTTGLIDDDPEAFRLGPKILESFAVPYEIFFRSKPAKGTLSEDYFEQVYSANEDPWDFEKSDYEAAKYAATIDALPSAKYENALEIGCSIGVLTRKLADRTARLLSTDVSERALDTARTKNADASHITFRKMSLPGEFPDETFDLIMVSEVAYYLDEPDWLTAMQTIFDHLRPNGHIVLVHWLPPVHDYPQTGDEVHDRFTKFAETKPLNNIRSERAENYRLDVWERLA